MIQRRQWRNVTPRMSEGRDGSTGVNYPEWMSSGLCAETDPEEFYPERGGSTARAKQLCASCPVQLACLTYALDNNEQWGVWGGMSVKDRAKLLRKASAA